MGPVQGAASCRGRVHGSVGSGVGLPGREGSGAVFVRAELSPSARPFGSRLAFPSGLVLVRWELRGRARSLDAEHQVGGFGELDGGEGVPVPGADPVPGGVKDEHGQVREPVAMDRE